MKVLIADDEKKLIVININREISKLNYRIHTDAIKGNSISLELTPYQTSITYAREANVLNIAIF